MTWTIYCLDPRCKKMILHYPFSVGRKDCNLSVDNVSVSKMHFTIESVNKQFILVNQSHSNPTILDGQEILDFAVLSDTNNRVYQIKAGAVVFYLAPSSYPMETYLKEQQVAFFVQTDGVVHGPFGESGLMNAYVRGILRPDSTMWRAATPNDVRLASAFVDFPDQATSQEATPPPPPPPPPSPIQQSAAVGVSNAPRPQRVNTATVRDPVLGESFMCPYCRTVSDLEDVLAVSVSPQLMGDDVLGDNEQQRFLPSQFAENGLAIDSEGGVCVDDACPHCHMALPHALLELPFAMMAVIGAAGAGKSVFLASSIWQCRQLLQRLFGISFLDLDPAVNRWINAYEEKLFFQEDVDALQQIEKTDLYSTLVSRSALLNGEEKLLPIPSFFSIGTPSEQQCLVVYDNAGEHFRPGADSTSSLVTLNMINADVLFFMYDPSADPRFKSYLDVGTGNAKNYAQRQDSLLNEVAARVRRHMGNRGSAKLKRPLIVGISKADLLRHHLPLQEQLYIEQADGLYALDVKKLKEISAVTQRLMTRVVPEVVSTALNIAEEVWFLPVSALGHNPNKDGVRPSEIEPIWAELPFVFTLYKKGLIQGIE